MQHLGRYQIAGELGRGAMGVVYRALDPKIGREVAVKTIRLNDFTDPRERGYHRERLFREARSAGNLSHRGIVTVFDADEQDGIAFIAMEYVHGPTLDRLLSGPEPLAPARMFAILRGAAEGLDYAHRKGIIHRDIKPANIMIDEAGDSKITDFGIAKVTSLDQLTHTGLIVGTPNYMAPEQVQGKPVNGRADQYSLCVIAYEMLTGDKPFNAEQITTLIYKIVCEEPEPPNRVNPTLGPKINATLLKGLAKNPEERYATCVGFIDALEEACRSTVGWQSLRRGGAQNLPTLTSELAVSPHQSGKGSTTETAVPSPASELLLSSAIASREAVAPERLAETARGPQPPPPAKPANPAVLAPPRAIVADMARLPTPVPRASRATRKTSVLAYFLLAAVCFGGLAGGYLAYRGPTVRPEVEAPAPAVQAELKKPEEIPAPEPPPPSAGQPQTEAQSESPASTAGPPPEIRTPPPPVERKRPSRAEPAPPPVPLDLTVSTEPQGARAILDGDSSAACVTPCSMRMVPGPHRLSFTRAGFRDTMREITVKAETTHLPAYTLAPAVGVLLIQSQPDGASIFINSRLQSQKTPAQINLPPGRYQISIEKGALRAAQTVELKDGALHHISVSLEP